MKDCDLLVSWSEGGFLPWIRGPAKGKDHPYGRPDGRFGFGVRTKPENADIWDRTLQAARMVLDP